MNIRSSCFNSREHLRCRIPAWLLLLISLLIFSPDASAQNAGSINGHVVDSLTRLPIDRVSVVIKGTRQGTSTDRSGAFALDVSGSQAVLEFSCIGYQPRELVVQKGRPVTVYLSMAVDTVSAVVVTAFGYQPEDQGFDSRVRHFVFASFSGMIFLT